MRDVREHQERGQGAAADAGPGGRGAPGGRSSGESEPQQPGAPVYREQARSRSASAMGTIWQGLMQPGDVPSLRLWELAPARKYFIRLSFVGNAF